MDNAEILQRAGAEILRDAEAFCDRASVTLDDLDAYGKEPVLDVSAADLFEDEAFYFTTPAGLLPEVELVTLPRKVRSLKAEEEPPVDASVDVSNVLEVAHAEDPEAWQLAIAKVMNRQGMAMSFGALRRMTGLSPGELLLGLLLGDWQLSQREFYGEVFCARDKN